MTRSLLLAGSLSVLLLPLGCALTSKSDPLSPRYFNPELSERRQPAAAPLPLELRLGQISSAANLDERIAYRINSTEVGFYEDRRWTELPEAYLRRALERELFEQRRLTRVVTGDAAVLDVELTAFEELRVKPPQVRVALVFSLRDQRRSLLERSVVLVRAAPVQAGGDSSQSVAQALADALVSVVENVGAEVTQTLSSAPRAPRGSIPEAQGQSKQETSRP